MRNLRSLHWLILGLATAPAALACAQQSPPHVAFVLLLEDPYGQRVAEKWHKLLDGLPQVSVRIRSGRRGERTGIEETSTGGYRVTGILSAKNRLDLPGGSFSLLDKAKIQKWVADLQGSGVETMFAPKLAFGLTAEQLTTIHEKLEHVVAASTKGQTVAQAARQIASEARLTLQSDPDARRGAGEVVANDAKGLAAGAALAMVLRPGGLVLTLEPPRRGGEVALRIRRGANVEEFWPVGWPVQGSLGKLAPDMFKRLDVEISPTPLEEALDAVSARLDTPIYLDHNALVREGIDPAEVRVKHPSGNTYYKRILDRLLSQAKLTGRWRQDEAGKVFYWVTTTKQAVREETAK